MTCSIYLSDSRYPEHEHIGENRCSTVTVITLPILHREFYMPHTPGPWIVDQVVSDHEYDICLGYQIPEAGSPILIASVYDDDDLGPIFRREASANAELISKSPKMLELLETVYKQAGNGAPAERRHALTPDLRDEIRDLLKSLNRFNLSPILKSQS